MNLRVNFNWKLALFVAFFLPILLRLGYWQLDRAEQKRKMIADYELLVTQPAVDYSMLNKSQVQNYRNVLVTGQLGEQVFLLDNQIFNQKVGYEVIQPALLDDGKIVFISRGWIEGNLDRTILPKVETPKGVGRLSGYLYQPNENLQLKEEIANVQWPRVIQSVNIEKLYKAIGKTDKIESPFLVRLNAGSAGAFEPHWQVVNVNPEKHTAYAMQWFGMAILLVGMFIFASLKRNP